MLGIFVSHVSYWKLADLHLTKHIAHSKFPVVRILRKALVINLYLLACFVGKFGDAPNSSSSRDLEMQKKISAFCEAPSVAANKNPFIFNALFSFFQKNSVNWIILSQLSK